MDLAGREAELGSLGAVLDGVAVGTSHVVGIVGEAGIGKTRLAQETVQLADQRGFVTLAGHASPRELAVAYAPIVEAPSEHLRSLDIVAMAATTSGLPELATLFGSLVPGRAEPLADVELEQARLFEAVARLLERIQDEAPVLLVVDDAHEADTASLALLHYLCRRLDRQRVLTLLTYRSEADSLRALRELHTTMRRLGRLDEVALEPLRRHELADLVARRLDGPPAEALLDLLEVRARGVPLFAETLLAGLRDSGALVRSGGTWSLTLDADPEVPVVARDVILRPLDRLEPFDRAVVGVLILEVDEVAAPLRGEPVRELVERREGQAVWVRANPGPASYGDEPPEPVLAGFSPVVKEHLQKLTTAVELVFEAGRSGLEQQVVDGALEGIAASPGTYTGRVRVILDESEFTKIRARDVLVCPITSPVWSVLFGSVGALVTDTGGVLSHAAIIAREYRIPAVVATGNATQLLEDGQLVTVDGGSGRVRLQHRSEAPPDGHGPDGNGR